jgi:hypothetical protein
VRLFLVIVAAVTLTAGYPVAAQPAADAAFCAEQAVAAEPGCCETTAGAPECPGNHCVGALAPLASPKLGRVLDTSEAPVSARALLLDPPARAPDTAPPKSIA